VPFIERAICHSSTKRTLVDDPVNRAWWIAPEKFPEDRGASCATTDDRDIRHEIDPQ
jgi:hypothetical protein